jgi:predicted nucleic acid binding AN1-type Zn finger protein
MAACNRCGASLIDPRPCSYCGAYFCGKHQLPERHDCTGVEGWERRGERFDSGFDDSVSA